MIREGYTRVTEILRQWDTFGHIDKDVLERKQEIGTNVHSAIKAHFEGIYFPLSEVEQPYFDSFMVWHDFTCPKIIESEERLYDDSLMITGAIDALIKFPHERETVLVDFKTSASPNQKMWTLQAGFYSMLAKNNGKSISNRVLFLQLNPKGKMGKIHEFEITEYVTQTCLAALKTYRYLNS